MRLLKILEYVYVTSCINNNYSCVNTVGCVSSVVLVPRCVSSLYPNCTMGRNMDVPNPSICPDFP